MPTTILTRHLKEYEKVLDSLRYDKQSFDKINDKKKTDSTFERLDNVPYHRFNNINPKIKSFPLLETQKNCFYYDFKDGLGPVYSYYWKNNPNNGIVSYWFQFDDDSTLEIDKHSTVSSGCRLFNKNGTITIKNSNLVEVEVWATDSISIENCPSLKNVFVFGSVSLNQISSHSDAKKQKNRFYTKDCSLDTCELNGNNLFYQDMYYPGPMKLKDCEINGQNEFIGRVSCTNSSFSGRIKIAGNVNTISSVFSDNAFVDAGYDGIINIQESKVSENATIINSATVQQSSIQGSALVSDFTSIKSSTIKDSAVVTDNATISSSTLSGFSQATMHSVVSGSLMSGHSSISGTASASGTSLSDYAIVTGDKTNKAGGSVSGNGRVMNGVSCPHGVSGTARHFNTKSCPP